MHHIDRAGRAVRICEIRFVRTFFIELVFPRSLKVYCIDQRGDKFAVVLGQDGRDLAVRLFAYPCIHPLDRIRVRDLLHLSAEIFVHPLHEIRQERARAVKPALVEPERVRRLKRHDARIAVIGLEQLLDALVERIQIVDMQGAQQLLLRFALCAVCQHGKAQADGIGRHRPVALRVQRAHERIRERAGLLRVRDRARGHGVGVYDPSHGFDTGNRVVRPEFQRTGSRAVRIGDVLLVRHVDHAIHPALAHAALRPLRNVVTRRRARAAARGQRGVFVVQVPPEERRRFLPGDGVIQPQRAEGLPVPVAVQDPFVKRPFDFVRDVRTVCEVLLHVDPRAVRHILARVQRQGLQKPAARRGFGRRRRCCCGVRRLRRPRPGRQHQAEREHECQ